MLFFGLVFDVLLFCFCGICFALQAENALESEKLRVANYLNPSTEAKLLRVCDDEMLEKRWGREGKGRALCMYHLVYINIRRSGRKYNDSLYRKIKTK